MKKNKKKSTNSIQVLGKTIRIVEDSALENAGEFFLNALTIKINKDQPEWQKKSTLMHEILHAILGITGISRALGEDLEEAVVVALEQGLDGLVEMK